MSAAHRDVNGVLLLDKPSGITSHSAMQKVRRLFNAYKAGHTGTLDPMATGLLPVCLGEATKFSHLLLEADKTYAATIRLGVTTTTVLALELSPVEEHGEASSSLQLADVLGSVIGIAAATAVFSARHAPGQDEALFGAIFLALALVAALAVPAGQRIAR